MTGVHRDARGFRQPGRGLDPYGCRLRGPFQRRLETSLLSAMRSARRGIPAWSARSTPPSRAAVASAAPRATSSPARRLRSSATAANAGSSRPRPRHLADRPPRRLPPGRGAVRGWSRRADSGRTLDLRLLRGCGSRLWHEGADPAEPISVKGGWLDTPPTSAAPSTSGPCASCRRDHPGTRPPVPGRAGIASRHGGRAVEDASRRSIGASPPGLARSKRPSLSRSCGTSPGSTGRARRRAGAQEIAPRFDELAGDQDGAGRRVRLEARRHQQRQAGARLRAAHPRP